MTTRHFLFALLLVVCTFSFHTVKSQGTTALKVTDMPGYPDLPQDTAYEQNTYQFAALLANVTNDTILSGVTLMLKADTVTTVLVVDTTSIFPGDTIAINISGYTFSPSQYKAGNNIVVVWPIVNSPAIPPILIDSFITDVFFIPLSSLDGIDLNEPSFHIYPVPSSTTLFMEFGEQSLVEQVRIYAVSGQLVRTYSDTRKNEIDISFLDKGLYFVEATTNGVSVRKKFVKY